MNACFRIFILILFPFILSAQQLWQSASLPRTETWSQEGPLPRQFKVYSLDLDQLKTVLEKATVKIETRNQPPVILEVPLPDGSFEIFQVMSGSVMHPQLAKKYPEIGSWYGFNPANPSRWIHLDLGPKGFHAMITSPLTDPVYIDPYERKSGKGPYLVFSKSDFVDESKTLFSCLTLPDTDAETNNREQSDVLSDGTFRTYRLALACTGEYGNFHGPTKTQVLAAMVTTINRINSIYEREFGLRMELVADNDKLIYLNAGTDPYDNSSLSTMLGQNQQECDDKIGTANYDVGHVFGTNGGGLATLSSPCNENTKARAATGLSNPVGDPFDVDYVAHEFGHQFGCNHTFNNSCSGNRNNATAWEPGSGSTIMSYSGVCAPNIKNSSDAIFHGGNLVENRNFSAFGNGNTCPEKLFTGNLLPVVTAGSDYIIPRSTPFELEAVGSDPNEDDLTYCWEQFDNQIATMPPVNTNDGGPTFRSFLPDTVPVRVFPNINAVLAGTSPTWEILPSVARMLNFRITVRDNHPGHGLWAQDAMQVTVDGTSGPFTVTNPNTSITWRVGDTMTVAWNRANTHVAPVNSSHVDIFLSLDGGYHYPIILASKVPNSGSTTIIVPFNLSNTCRIKVKGNGNIFFDVSNANFSIKEPVLPGFLANGQEDTLSYCSTNSDTLTLSVALQSLSNFNGPISLNLNGLIGLMSDLPVTFSLSGKDTLIYRIWGMNDLLPGSDQFQLVLNVPGLQRTLTYTLKGFAPLSSLPVPVFPPDNADSIVFTIPLSWTAVPEANEYFVEVATSPAFGTHNVIAQIVRDTMLPVALLPSTHYYWRVSPGNVCGIQSAHRVWAFRTVLEECQDYLPPVLPVVIPNDEAFIANSIITVPGPGKVASVEVFVDLEHAKLEDVTLRLLHPSGNARSIFAKSCVDGQDIQATFSDEGDPFTCSGQQPAVTGLVQPATGLFTNLLGLNVAGNWALRIIDDFAQGGGVLNDWKLNICKHLPPPPTPYLTQWDTLQGSYCQPVILQKLNLELTDTLPGTLQLLLREAPLHGTLQLAGNALKAGDTFTVGDIENEQITYLHDGSLLWEDSLLIDGYNTETKGWLPGLLLAVRTTAQLEAMPVLVESVQCPGEANASVHLGFNSCRPPFEYRLLPGGPWQSESDFDSLGAGTYFFEVRDSNGFTAISSPFEILDPEVLSASFILKGDTLFVQGMGGVGPYSFILGPDTNSTGQFILQASGNYTVQVIDANGCVQTISWALELLSVTFSTAPIACFGEASGAILVNASGGMPPYTYRLNGGNWQSDSLFTGLTAGNYFAELQDASGAIRNTGVIVLDQPEVLTLEAQQTQDSTALLQAMGGTPPYRYRLETGVFQSDTIFSSLGKGTYLFVVEDLNGCLDSTTLTIVSSSLTDVQEDAIQVLVYPNPSNGSFQVEIAGSANSDWRWSIRDILGREVASGMSRESTWFVDQPGLASGMYYLRLENDRILKVVPLRME